jgi:hypothetical protein
VKPQQVPRPNHLDHLSDDGRGYPVISTVGRDEGGADFGSINERRKLALAARGCRDFGVQEKWELWVRQAMALHKYNALQPRHEPARYRYALMTTTAG